MLEIINNLKPFFEDCYRRINVREYARLTKISPPTASKILYSLEKEGILKKETERNYLFFYANKENSQFIALSRIYWKEKLNNLIEYLKHSLISPTVILFGSLSKAEAVKGSDIDLVIISKKREIKIAKFKEKLGRNIQIFWFDSFESIKDKELKNNIINGYILNGKIKL